MQRTLVTLLLCLPALALGAVDAPEGRWEGAVLIPGRDLQVVVDLARNPAGTWAGSIIVQGQGIKGAPLANVVVTATDVAFDLGNVLASPTQGPAGFKARVTAIDGMAGEMRQGGNTARFAFARTGPAQLELPPRSTPVARDLAGAWTGEFELGGYPRRVTVTLESHAGEPAAAALVIVGKETNNLPVDLVTAEDNLLRLESQANRVVFEGHVSTGRDEITGVIELGPYELPLVLRRPTGSAS